MKISESVVKSAKTLIFLSIILLCFLFLLRIYNGLKLDTEENVLSYASVVLALCSFLIAYLSYCNMLSKREPDLLLELDFNSRYGLCLFVISNIGREPAYNIMLHFKKDVSNVDGRMLSDIIPEKFMLAPQQDLTFIVNGVLQVNYDTDEIKGEVTFEEKALFYIVRKREFHLIFKPYKNTPSFEKEKHKTAYELNKLPEILTKINASINKLGNKS